MNDCIGVFIVVCIRIEEIGYYVDMLLCSDEFGLFRWYFVCVCYVMDWLIDYFV